MNNAINIKFFALLTTVYLASAKQESTLQISTQCYEAGKACLEAHLCWFPKLKQYQSGGLVHIYLSWILLYAALSPIVTVFVHAIANTDPNDVELLRQFEASLTSGEFLHEADHPQTERDRIVRTCATFRRAAEERLSSGPPTTGILSGQDLISIDRGILTNLSSFPVTTSYNDPFPDADAFLDHSAAQQEPAFDVSVFFNDWINDPLTIGNFL